jgi:hypothetical protein
VIRGARGEHLLAEADLAGVVGRRGDGQDQLGAGERLGGRGAGRIPDVLADVHRDDRAPGPVRQLEHGGLDPGLEVPVLVEDAVVRQVLLVVDAGEAAVVGHRRRVRDVVPPVHEADDDGEADRGADDVVEGAQVALDERRLEEEVLRRVAGERQLGEGHQVDAEGAGARQRLEDAARVPLEVADRRVDLAEPDPEEPHVEGSIPPGPGAPAVWNGA